VNAWRGSSYFGCLLQIVEDDDAAGGVAIQPKRQATMAFVVVVDSWPC